MKNVVLILIPVLFALCPSCKKKDNSPPADNSTPPPPGSSGNTCLMSTFKVFGTDVESYTFDSNHKVVSFVKTDLNTSGKITHQVTYNANTLIIREYLLNNTLINTTTVTLNNTGNAVSSIAVGIDTLYGSGAIARNKYDTASYIYDSNGFLIHEIHNIKTVEIISGNTSRQKDSTSFTIQNETIVSAANTIKTTYTSGSSQQTNNYTYTYNTTLNKSGQIITSGGKVSLTPFFYKGKQSKYLVQTSSDGLNPTTTYTYTLNSNGYVTGYDDGNFTRNYTYMCY